MNTASSSNLPDKLVAPAVKRAIARHRLYGLLNSARQSYRLIWLPAPAGSGKTTLAATYAEHAECPVLWYRLDADDSDPAAFFQHFLMAAEARFGLAATPATFNPGFLNNLSAYSRQFFGSILHNDTRQRLIVFDDYHAVQDFALLQQVLEALFRTAADNYRILVFSRNHPPAYCLNLLYNQLTVVPAGVLSFSAQEAAQLLAAKDVRLESARFAQLLAQTGGWAAALAVISKQAQADCEPGAPLPEDPAQQAWLGLPAQTRRRLLGIALPQTVSESVAIELTGEAETGITLFNLAEDQYLLSRIESDPPIYKLHPLLRQFLLEQLRGQTDTTRYADRISEVAGILQRNHQLGEAAELYAQAENWACLSGMILTHAPAELAAGRAVRLLSWLESLPETERQDPWLAYWYAAASLPFNPKRAQAFFERAHAGFGSDPLGRLLSAAGVVTAMYLAWDDFIEAPGWLRELAELDAFRAGLNDPEVDTWVLGCGNMLVNLDSDHGLLQNWITRAETLIQVHAKSDQLFLVNFLLQTRIWQGDFSGCRALLMQIQTEQSADMPLMKITLLIWSAVNAFLEADHAKAYQTVEQARILAENFDLRFLLPQIYGQEIYTALSCHDVDRAGQALQNMYASLLPDRRQDRGFYLHVKSCWLLLRDELAQARKEAEATLQISLDTGVASSASLVEHVLAQILIAECDWACAKPRLDRIEAYCRQSGFHYILFMLQLTRAGGLLSAGDEAAAIEVLQTALPLGRSRRYLNAHPQWQIHSISRLCALALERQIEPDYVRLLIRERKLPPGNDARESWPWPVKIRTLGGFRVDAAGQAVQAGKKDNKPLLLLQLLITINPDGVPRQVLADQIWPDADADTALHAFEVNLQRLRKMLGRQDALILSGGNLYLNRNLCWLDIWTLDELSRRLDQQLIAAETVVRRLLAIWRGPFLPGQTGPGSEAKRLLLAAKFVRVMTQIGLTLVDQNKPECAIEAFRKAVEVEPLAEQLHYRLIKILLDQGRPLDALAAYRLYASIHSSHWGHQASDTLKLCRDLLSQT
ncbi:BTAD domain-containing putative transcriptional regulator [Methylomonas rhizoryzae]|uniref:BTAD domain-containing putative transcriptional regulator n=1 Tax=Methylomonas rhizoryzae TaxID=2608981 RepID=UPI001680C5C7|nr:BTAD domain-containing putative transcriptional regulator [Methylomonas rhizoryzae]